MLDVEHPEGDAGLRSLLWTFENQTVLGHALLVLGGVGVWIGVYAFWLEFVLGSFELAVANSSEAVLARRSAIRAATIVGWTWFALGFVRGKGGPMLNFFYAVALPYLGHYSLSYFVLDEAPYYFYSADSSVSLGFVGAVIYIVLPGMLFGLAIVFGSLAVMYLVTGTGHEWERKHMPEKWHERWREYEWYVEDGTIKAKEEASGSTTPGDDDDGDDQSGGDQGRGPPDEKDDGGRTSGGNGGGGSDRGNGN